MDSNLNQCDTPVQFPFECKLSFKTLIGYWENRTNDENSFIATTAKEIVSQVKKIPALNEPMDDLSLVKEHQSIIDLLMMAIFSPYTVEEEMVSAMTPFKKEDIYSTKAYKDLMQKAGCHDALLDPSELEDIMKHKTMAAYIAIMEMFYGISISMDKDIVYTLNDERTGLKRYFKISINPKFCDIALKGDLPQLTDKQMKLLIDRVGDISLWKKLLPPALFEFQGLVIFKLNEVTRDQVLSRIKENLLEKDSLSDEARFKDLELKFRSLLQLSDLKLGIAGYQKSKNTFINFNSGNERSILLGSNEMISCDTTNASLYEMFSKGKEPMIVEDLANCCTNLKDQADMIMDQGVQNLILSPLFYNGEFVGLLELASPNKGDLNALTLTKIKNVLPLFAVAVKRNSDELENTVQRIIKEKYTSIHPTVEWKFNNAAHEMLDQIAKGLNPVAPQIVFKEVYPLYAASDIRNSSVERQNSIYKDLNRQLKLAKVVLVKALDKINLPILDETIFRLDNYRKKIKNKMVTGDEATILEFLQSEVEPLINNLTQNHLKEAGFASEYWNALDENLGVVYEQRLAFEKSLTEINNTIGYVLDEEEKKAQLMFPHYFEKYKTDGVEHNIYIGESLVDNLKFDQIYLKNIRLWQLVVTAEIASKTAALVPNLPMPLETTHLILVHSNPLSIRFRQEEKKFDVDGAYNIRYEITKKRIDKAHVKDSDERITQPGKIAIIYSQEKDAIEYKTFIDYLKSKNLLSGEIEYLELEELQGVSGLKALRISVNIGSTSIMDEVKKLLEVA